MVDEDATPVAFLGITETWWRCYMTEAQVQIPGYNLARCDRQGRIGGGCALYIHDSMAISDQMEYSDRDNNLVAVYIGSKHTVAAVIYRAGSDPDGFQEMMRRLQVFVDFHSQETTVPDVWLAGDFNLPLFKWEGGIPEIIDQPLYNVHGSLWTPTFLPSWFQHPPGAQMFLICCSPTGQTMSWL